MLCRTVACCQHWVRYEFVPVPKYVNRIQQQLTRILKQTTAVILCNSAPS
jgi:hypothetical protein